MPPSIDDYIRFLSHLPTDASDPALITLKGHLLVEWALRSYIAARVPHPNRLKDSKISFHDIVEVASWLEDDKRIEWVWSACKKLNQCRNELSHNLNSKKFAVFERDFLQKVPDNGRALSIETEYAPQNYGRLASAILIVYDALITSSPPHTSKSLLGNDLTKAFATALRSVDSGRQKGPQGRKKW